MSLITILARLSPLTAAAKLALIYKSDSGQLLSAGRGEEMPMTQGS